MNELPVIGADIVHLDRHTFMWVQLTHFGQAPESDTSALAALIASPGYDHDYASLFQVEQGPARSVDEHLYPPLHGRWWLSAIDVGGFALTTAAEAEKRIRSWANDQNWIDSSYRQPPAVFRRLQPVFDLLRVGNVYTLLPARS